MRTYKKQYQSQRRANARTTNLDKIKYNEEYQIWRRNYADTYKKEINQSKIVRFRYGNETRKRFREQLKKKMQAIQINLGNCRNFQEASKVKEERGAIENFLDDNGS